MSLFGGITDTLFGSGSDGQEKANKRSYEYTKEMADQSRNDAIKETILSDRNKVTKQLLLTMLQDRKAAYL